MYLSTTEELIDTYVARNWAHYDDGDIAFRDCFIDMLLLICRVAMEADEFDFADDIGFLADVALMK